eukprot:12557166-Ditylum_brightwellii.AAC.1
MASRGDCRKSAMLDGDIEDIHNSILINIADNMGMLVTELTYDDVNVNNSRAEGFILCRVLGPAMKESFWYVQAGLDPVKVNMR